MLCYDGYIAKTNAKTRYSQDECHLLTYSMEQSPSLEAKQ